MFTLGVELGDNMAEYTLRLVTSEVEESGYGSLPLH